jgi:hypothetical protein
VYIRSTPTLFQANSKFSQIEQSPANAEQNPAKKKAWISLDFLVGNEPFQWVALTPGAKKSFLSPFLPGGGHSGVIARSEATRRSRSHGAFYVPMDCFAALAIDDGRVTLHSANEPMYNDF